MLRIVKNLAMGWMLEMGARQVHSQALAIIEQSGGSSSTGRAPDCGSDGCGFDSRLPPQYFSQLATLRSVCAPFAAHWGMARAATFDVASRNPSPTASP